MTNPNYPVAIDDMSMTVSHRPAGDRFESALALYSEIATHGPRRGIAECMVSLRHWFDSLASFDPRSGEPLPQGLSDVTKAVRAARPPTSCGWMDLPGRIVEHVREALGHVLMEPRTRVLREHKMLPVHAARELDGACLEWLSRQCGRTVREKVGSRAMVLAVKRRMSIDTAENRLVLAFARQLAEILDARVIAFGDDTPENRELRADIGRWLRQPETQEIGCWGNVAPNNALLQDRNYRRIWDGWLRLQSLDEDIRRDEMEVAHNWLTAVEWQFVAMLDEAGLVRIPEQPCLFNYPGFKLSLALGNIDGWHLPAVRKQDSTVQARQRGRVLSIDPKGFIFSILENSDGQQFYFLPTDLVNPKDLTLIKKFSFVDFDLEATPRGNKAVRISIAAQQKFSEQRTCAPAQSELIQFRTQRPEPSTLVVQLGKRSLTLRIESGKDVSGVLVVDGGRCAVNFTVDAAARCAKDLLTVFFANRREGASLPSRRSPIALQRGTGRTVVDLATSVPRFATSGGVCDFPAPLALQFWKVGGEFMALDLGGAQAIALSSDRALVSLATLLYDDSGLPPDLLHRASHVFAAKFQETFGNTQLTYLVPDAVDDFALEFVRRGINAHFDGAEPLPRSVALLFSWLASGNAPKRIDPGDEVLVLDCIGDLVSLTPLVAAGTSGAKILAEKIPETFGLVWERHPSIPIGHGGSEAARTKAHLSEQKCGFAETLARLLGQAAMNPARSWQDEEGGVFTPDASSDTGRTALEWHSSFLQNLRASVQPDCLPEHTGQVRQKTWLLVSAEARTPPIATPPIPGRPEVRALWYRTSLVEGALQLQEWQDRAGEYPLWKEFLPELSIRVTGDGYFKRLILVKAQSVVPKRGEPVRIPVSDDFVLPVEKTEYKFPLRQGGSGSRLQYEAVLKDPAFPVKEPVHVKLKMSFTYGNDVPYELEFVPVGESRSKAGFRSVKAKWQVPSLRLESIAPGFPPAPEWDDLARTFRKRDAKYSLLDRLLWALGRVVDSRLNAGSMQPGGEALSQLTKTVTGARNDVLRIWNQGRNLQERMCPDEFRSVISVQLPKLCRIARAWGEVQASGREHQKLFRELLFLLCTLHVDLPDEGVDLVREIFNREFCPGGKMGFHRPIACALGDALLDWQQQMLRQILDQILQGGKDKRFKSVMVEMFGIALWRSQTLLGMLRIKEISWLIDSVHAELSRYRWMLASASSGDGPSESLVQGLTPACELLLALLRTRDSADPAIARLLAPGAEWTRRFALLVEEVAYDICPSGHNMRSHIKLDTGKPDFLHRTPDLLYSIGLFLGGDTGAQGIQVMDVALDEGSD